ncbi:MAG: type II secretion system F family protein [Armatimonadota bacterium]
MPNFRYRGLDTTGKSVVGDIIADDERVAVAQLKAQGFFASEMREVKAKQPAAANTASGSSTKRMSFGGGNMASDVTVLTRQLSNLITGGISVIPAFVALTEHTENPQLRGALDNMQDEIKGGKTLWETLALYPSIFPPLYVNMVKAGEASGQLGSVLAWLADYLESEQNRRTQIRGALAYPILLVSVGILSIGVLLTTVVPKFTGMFEEFQQALPMPTVVLLQVSHFLVHWGWALLLGILVMFFAVRRYGQTKSGRYRLDAWKLGTWWYRRIGFRAAISRFARTTATLLHGGVPLFEALAVVRDVLDNEVLARATDEVREGMREGERFAERLKQAGVFPPLLTHMVGIGEETGDLRSVLATVANTYDVEVEATLKGMVSLLEPVIIIAMGSIIGFIILAMLLPVFSINVLGS